MQIYFSKFYKFQGPEKSWIQGCELEGGFKLYASFEEGPVIYKKIWPEENFDTCKLDVK